MTKQQPDNTAVRVALWRALHVRQDPPPHVLEDELGLTIAEPEPGWDKRPDMSHFTRPFRASIVARARFVEDLLEEQKSAQYVILGAGLDTYAQRRKDTRVQIFEIDQPETQAWKRERLVALKLPAPHLVPVDFEKGENWLERLTAAGFDARKPSLISSLGVSMYLTRDAIASTLRQISGLGSATFVMSFLLPIEMSEPDVRPGIEAASRGAKAAGTPWLSFFKPEEMLALARECGFRSVRHVSAAALAERYFAGRADGLRPPVNSEELLVATT